LGVSSPEVLASLPRRCFGDALMQNAQDRSHLADALHLIDAIQLIDEEVPAVRAAVNRSKAAVASAKTDLDQHQRWVERHHELTPRPSRGANVGSNSKP
jgi:hypothetical protein